jgi:hypothetical protein
VDSPPETIDGLIVFPPAQLRGRPGICDGCASWNVSCRGTELPKYLLHSSLSLTQDVASTKPAPPEVASARKSGVCEFCAKNGRSDCTLEEPAHTCADFEMLETTRAAIDQRTSLDVCPGVEPAFPLGAEHRPEAASPIGPRIEQDRSSGRDNGATRTASLPKLLPIPERCSSCQVFLTCRGVLSTGCAEEHLKLYAVPVPDRDPVRCDNCAVRAACANPIGIKFRDTCLDYVPADHPEALSPDRQAAIDEARHFCGLEDDSATPETK